MNLIGSMGCFVSFLGPNQLKSSKRFIGGVFINCHETEIKELLFPPPPHPPTLPTAEIVLCLLVG